METHDAIRHLWVKVILQAMRDAMTTRVKPERAMVIDRRAARRWLEGHSADFRQVCTMAGFEPEVVRNWWIGVKDNQEALGTISKRFRDTYKAERLK